jgi:hypothetical protein
MARFIFFLLLIANVALGAHLYLSVTQSRPVMPPELNRDALKVVSVADPGKAQQEALAARKLASSLAGAACVNFGVKPADGPRAQQMFAAMNLGERLGTRNVEDYTRFAVSLPPQKDKRAADTLVAALKKAGVRDVSVLGDASISLGLYSSDEAARKVLADVQGKAASLAREAVVTPRNPQLKEVQFTVKDPDVNMVARLTLMQRDYEGSSLNAASCTGAGPVVTGSPAAAVPPAETASAAKK